MNELIVCATDFSPQADAALAWAAALARRDGGHVDLVHATPVPREQSRGIVLDAGQFEAEQVRQATEQLREAARAAAQKYDISVRPQLLRGEPHEQILRHAREEDARLVVLGTCGLAAVERWMLGSVADRTVRTADRPVVLVPRATEQQPWAPHEDVPASRAPRVVAGLGEGDDSALLRFVADLRRNGPADVTFVHLYWPAGEYHRLGIQPRDVFAADPEIVKLLTPPLRDKIAALPGRGEIELDVRPAWGEPASNLLVAVEDHEADLLVVAAHGRHGLSRLVGGSVGRRLARQSRYVPVAIVPSPPPAQAAESASTAEVPAIHTVLAATDLSPLGNAAVAHACSLLRGTGGVVELCFVHEHALPASTYPFETPAQQLSDVDRARLSKELRALVPAQAAAWGITAHVVIVDGGRPAEAIAQASERLDVDAICITSRGRSGLARAVLGSVAQEVVQRARRPVFVVRSR